MWLLGNVGMSRRKLIKESVNVPRRFGQNNLIRILWSWFAHLACAVFLQPARKISRRANHFNEIHEWPIYWQQMQITPFCSRYDDNGSKARFDFDVSKYFIKQRRINIYTSWKIHLSECLQFEQAAFFRTSSGSRSPRPSTPRPSATTDKAKR